MKVKANKYILFFALILFFSIKLAGLAQVFSFETKQNLSTAIFPAGALFKGIIQNEVSSDSSHVGDKVYLLIPFDIKIGKITCIPKKSVVAGEVIRVEKAQQGRNGLLQIKFDYIKFSDGWGTKLTAHIWNHQGDGVIGGEPTRKNDYKKVVHYIEDIGAVVQLVETGSRIMGKEKFIKVGTEIIIVLDNNLEVRYLDKF